MQGIEDKDSTMLMEEDEEYVHPLVKTFLELISEEQSAETRQHGLKMLLIAWIHGVSLQHDLILCLVSLSSEDASEAELVCFILGSISNVGIVHDGHFKGWKVPTSASGFDLHLSSKS
ncbi:hypothetical protein ABZP36_008808 [Zizania latifolia]